MALANKPIQYVSSVKYAAIDAWSALTVYAAGALVRQATTPTIGNERVFVCIIAGTSLAVEPTWVVTKGALTAEATGPTWQEITGQPEVNGDIVNCKVWPTATTVTLGQIIYVASNGSLQICNVASGNTSGTIPAFSATAGVVTNDGSNRWTSLGLASAFGAFAAPHARVENSNASTWQTVVPAKIFIDSTHAQTQSSGLDLGTGQATPAVPNQYLSVSASGAIPPTSCTVGASISTTGGSNLRIGGYAYFYGITFNAGSGASQAMLILQNNATYQVFESCTLALTNTNGNSGISGNATGNRGVMLINCNLIFNATGQAIGFSYLNMGVIMLGGSIALTGTVPTYLFNSGQGGSPRSLVFLGRDIDLSAVNTTLCRGLNDAGSDILLENCKLAAGVGMLSVTAPDASYLKFRLHNCDSGTKNYRFYETDGYTGSATQETSIVRTGGATDGVQQLSWNITPTASALFGQPFVTDLPIAQYSSLTTGSHTATIYLTSDAVLTDANFWLELENFASASFPIGTNTTSRIADALTTPTGLTADAVSTWGGAAKTYKYSITVSFSPAMAGYLKARLYACSGATAVYVDPKIYIDGAATSSKQYLLPGGAYINETGSSGGMIQSRVFTGM